MKTPEAGDIWEWLDPEDDPSGKLNMIVLLLSPSGRIDEWNSLCLDSNDPADKGLTFRMSFGSNVVCDGWSFLA